MKKLAFILLILLPVLAFGQVKEYDRNELPQLSQEILESSSFTFTPANVPTDSIIPVQTQRVSGLAEEERRLIAAEEDTYRPLVIDRDNYLIDGHHRLDALTNLDIETARVFIVDATIEEVVAAFPEYRDNTPTYEPTIEMIEVVGTRATLMNAIDRQRDAQNIISVVDSDALGNFPDSTAADAIRRLSGIAVENDQGEGRYVTIRGLSSDLNSVAVNGASMVAPENGRSVIMDGLPTELLDTITVAKTLTPEMDADSIGGRVEFDTKKPTDFEDTLFKAKLSSKFAEYTGNKQAPNFALTYGDYIGDYTAHIVGLTYSSKYIESFNNETGFGWEDGFMNDDWEMRWYDVQRERYGFNYSINTITDDASVFYANILYNQYDETETRFKDEYGKIKFDGALTDGMVTSRIRHDAETKQRFEVRTIGSINAGWEAETDNGWTLDSQIGYSWAEEDDSDNADITFRNYNKKIGGEFYWQNPTRPYFVSYDPTLRDPANLEFDAFETWQNLSRDEERSFQFNAESYFGDHLVKAGVKIRNRQKDVDDYIIGYTWDGKTMADWGSVTIENWFFENQVFGNHVTGADVYSMRQQVDQMEVDFEDAIGRDFVTDEDITAFYVQDTYETNNAVIIAGVRYESTRMSSTAFDQDGRNTKAENNYGFISPSLTVKYFLTDQWQLRGALWRGLSRPGFKETAPITAVDTATSGEVSGSVGNPGLQPYIANNIDVSLEYYGDDMSYFAVGLFRKDIENAIYPTVQKEATVNGIAFNAGVETWINSDTSFINGLELNGQYGWENGLYVATNLTFTDSESQFNYDDDQVFTTPFRKLAERAANFSIGYDQGPWDVRLAGNYRSDYLDWLSDENGEIGSVSENNSRWVAPFMQVDLVAKYELNDNLTFRAEAANLNNRPEFYYWGNPGQLSQYDMFGRNYTIGFNYTL